MTSTDQVADQGSIQHPAVSGSARARAMVVAAAASGAAVTWLVVRIGVGDPLAVTFSAGEAQSVTVLSAIMAAIVAGGMGWALLAVLGRVGYRAKSVWTALASVVLLLSLGGPLSADADAATTTALVAMHLVVGVILIVGLRRTIARH